jgi:hypothetical protein
MCVEQMSYWKFNFDYAVFCDFMDDWVLQVSERCAAIVFFEDPDKLETFLSREKLKKKLTFYQDTKKKFVDRNTSIISLHIEEIIVKREMEEQTNYFLQRKIKYQKKNEKLLKSLKSLCDRNNFDFSNDSSIRMIFNSMRKKATILENEFILAEKKAEKEPENEILEKLGQETGQ